MPPYTGCGWWRGWAALPCTGGGSGLSSTAWGTGGGGRWCPDFFRRARLDTIRSCWLWPEPEPGDPSCRIILSVSMVVAATANRGIELTVSERECRKTCYIQTDGKRSVSWSVTHYYVQEFDNLFKL